MLLAGLRRRFSRAAAASIALAAAISIAACDDGSARPRSDAGSAAMDAPGVIDAPADAGPSGPDPSCVVADVVGDLSVSPTMPAAGEALTISAGDATALTNVELVACTPLGPRTAGFLDVSGTYAWRFSLVEGLPLGESQLIFRSDPPVTVRATMRLSVSAAATDAGTPPADTPPSGACGPLAGSLIDGTFEAGLSGDAPPGWQVRDPAYRAGCGAGHLAIVASDPACGGSALAIDALGSWDCYAIQTFTDYDTITAGSTYRVHARVRAERQDNPAAWFVLGVQWLDASDAVFGDEKNPMLAGVNYDWTVLDWDLVAPAGARRAVVWLSAHHPGRVTYDDVSIAPAP